MTTYSGLPPLYEEQRLPDLLLPKKKHLKSQVSIYQQWLVVGPRMVDGKLLVYYPTVQNVKFQGVRGTSGGWMVDDVSALTSPLATVNQ